MWLTKDEINRNIRWLLAQASSPVKYLTTKHILREDSASQQMRALWAEVAQGPDADEILSRQNDDGSWFSGGPWGPRGYRRQTPPGYTADRPKFVTTAWILPYLGEMGFTVDDARVRASGEYIVQHIDLPEPVTTELERSQNCCGLYAAPLRALASIGMASDRRLEGRWDRLLQCQRSDGGWLNPSHLADSPTPSKTQGRWPWDRSCVWGSTFAAQALYASDVPNHRGALRQALEFLLWHLSQQDLEHIRTWVYHGHAIVRELLMFSEAEIDMTTAPVQALLSWLRGYYRPDEGAFRTQDRPAPGFVRQVSAIVKEAEARYGPDYWTAIPKVDAPVLRYHLYHLVEDDWLTYYLTRIAANLLPESA